MQLKRKDETAPLSGTYSAKKIVWQYLTDQQSMIHATASMVHESVEHEGAHHQCNSNILVGFKKFCWQAHAIGHAGPSQHRHIESPVSVLLLQVPSLA